MAVLLLFRYVLLSAGDAFSGWWKFRLPTKVAAGASLVVLSGMACLGFVLTGYIKENIIQRSAAAAALYMDSFTECYVQELAAGPALSDENRQALERLLSPASTHRPIIAFRIWNGDTIAFSNERELIGMTYPRSASRRRAWQGQVAVEFEQPDGDDDLQVRSLMLPVLEVYAPVRERGTGRIIALVETYEIGVELKREVWIAQLAAWAVITSIAFLIVVLLFGIVRAHGTQHKRFLNRIAELSRLRTQSENRRRKISVANLHLGEFHERSLRRAASDLNIGPIQFLALVLVKFRALEELTSRAKAAMPSMADQYAEDLEIIHKALTDALNHVRCVATDLFPANVADLSVSETFVKAVRCHERQTGVAVEFKAHGLPRQLPFPVKACLYRIILESLTCSSAASGAQAQSIIASYHDDKLMIEIASSDGCGHPQSHPISNATLRTLRSRIEAIGGDLSFGSTPAGGRSLVAELNFSDMDFEMELAGG
jgi:signal transduction histidine kinase